MHRPELSASDLVPAEVAARWLRFRGDVAARWLTSLPDEAAAAAAMWRVVVLEPLWGGTQSVTVAGTRDGEPVVMKLSAPWATWSTAEAAALEAWDGRGAPRLHAAADGGRRLLLERLFPGDQPHELTPDDVAGVLERLRPIRASLPLTIPSLQHAVRQRFARAAENRHRLVTDKLRRGACEAAVALASEPPARTGLVHGDLVTKNILTSNKHGFAAIDPNPSVGDTAYDAALWVVTQPRTDDYHHSASRLASALGIDVAVILRWILVLAVPEACLAPFARAQASLAYVEAQAPDWL